MDAQDPSPIAHSPPGHEAEHAVALQALEEPGVEGLPPLHVLKALGAEVGGGTGVKAEGVALGEGLGEEVAVCCLLRSLSLFVVDVRLARCSGPVVCVSIGWDWIKEDLAGRSGDCESSPPRAAHHHSPA